MKISFLLMVLTVISALIGCSSSSVIMNEKYEDRDLSDKKLMIVPFSETIVSVENKDDVSDDFESDKREPELVIKIRFINQLLRIQKNFLRG